MKEIHFQIVGFPRTGTTWLWNSLINNRKIFETTSFKEKSQLREKLLKELKENVWQEQNLDLLLKDSSEYTEQYKKYNITLNFRPLTFLLGRQHIEKIAKYTTHAAIIMRNPYEILDSFYNMQINIARRPDLDEFSNSSGYEKFSIDWMTYKKSNPHARGNNAEDVLNFYIKQFDFFNTVCRWLEFKNKFKIFYYEDLLAEPATFYKNVCDFIMLEPNNEIKKSVNSTSEITQNKIVKFNYLPYQIETINRQIDQLSGTLQRDFKTWKR